MTAWDKFFCAACQRERPTLERVRIGKQNLVRCAGCATKSNPAFKPKRHHVEEDYDFVTVPESIIESYREAME